MLVIPRLHIRNLYEVPDPLLGPMLQAVKRVAVAVHEEFAASGTTIRQNNEPPGQDVFHLHFHVIPRFGDDHLATAQAVPIAPEARAAQASRLRSRLSNL